MKSFRQSLPLAFLAVAVLVSANLSWPTCHGGQSSDSAAAAEAASPTEPPAPPAPPEAPDEASDEKPANQKHVATIKKETHHSTNSASNSIELSDMPKLLASLKELANKKNDSSDGETFTAITALMIPILGILIPFVTIMVCVGLFLMFRHRRQKVLHETIRAMIEKGMPIPPELLSRPALTSPFGTPPPYRGSRERDFRRGVILVGIGIGLFIAIDPKPGIICLMIGAAFFISGMMTKREENIPPRP